MNNQPTNPTTMDGLTINIGDWFIADIIGPGIYKMVEHGINRVGMRYAIVELKKLFGKGIESIGHKTTCHPIDLNRWNSLRIVKKATHPQVEQTEQEQKETENSQMIDNIKLGQSLLIPEPTVSAKNSPTEKNDFTPKEQSANNAHSFEPVSKESDQGETVEPNDYDNISIEQYVSDMTEALDVDMYTPFEAFEHGVNAGIEWQSQHTATALAELQSRYDELLKQYAELIPANEKLGNALSENQARVKELDQELGLAKIYGEQQESLRISCETALVDRDDRIQDLQAQVDTFVKHLTT